MPGAAFYYFVEDISDLTYCETDFNQASNNLLFYSISYEKYHIIRAAKKKIS